MRRILVTGGSGQLGRAIRLKSSTSPNSYLFATHKDLDICDSEAVERYIAENEIDTIINCAAYTNVEGAEEHTEEAYAINRNAVTTLAEVCNNHGIKLIHISTDYVFGGNKERNTPYTEDDTPEPVNVYGESKAQGELEALKARDSITIRTSWLYSPWCKNFLLTILRLAGEREEINVVNDQRGTPTSALGLAETLVDIIDSGATDDMSCIYHYADGGECTWYDFARTIVEEAGIDSCRVVACSSREREMKAERPSFSVLDTRRIGEISGIRILPWRERLKEVMDIIKESL